MKKGYGKVKKEEKEVLVSTIKENELTDETIDRLLYQGIEDPGGKADCIVVLGSIKASKYRVPVAVNAYKTGRADKLLFSGGAVRDFPDGRCIEADHMYKKALELGVPKEDIILERESKNTVENILCTMVELQRAFYLDRIGRILLVTAEYHMRRGLAIARYLFPQHIEVITCPAKDDNTSRENWRNSDEGRKRAYDEAVNILTYVRNGVFPDFEI